jgi:pyruvate/2-oxoglutarate dehydrogenase complex dihydrolipoamide dehydrogenase (E3) component
MADRYDAIVIGAGPVGQVCAGELADGGMRVAIVERELVGGECSYWACIPSKTLLRPGEAVEAAREVDGAEQAVSGSIDVGKALAYRDFMTSSWDDTGALGWLDGKGIALLRGVGRIAGPGSVAVGSESDSGSDPYACDQIVIATGSSPVIPPIDGLRELDGVWTNREAMEVKELPASLVVLGGGPVGVELAQAFRRFGSEVTLCEGESRLLPREPAAVGEAVASALSAEGITLRLGEQASSAAHEDGSYVLRFGEGDDVRGEKLLVATGRRARLDQLGLDKVGIEPSRRGIEVDESLRAGDGVWAIGDATGILPFTHVGKYQARVAARAMLGDSSARADYRAVPRVVFCDPQVAAVGDTDGGSATGTAQLSGVARTSTYTREYASRPGFLTLVADGSKLVGAYAVGPEAGEWLQQATLAVRAEVPLDVLRDTIQPFPTFSEAFVNALVDLGSP